MDDTVEEDIPICGFFSYDELNVLREISIPELERKVVKALELQDYVVSLESGILLDYYVSALIFAREEDFDARQTDCLLFFSKIIIDNCKSRLTMEENIISLKEQLKTLTTIEEEGCLPRLNVKEGKLIADYVMKSIFQHYKLYQALFFTKQEVTFVHNKLLIQSIPSATLPFPSPLEEGMPKELYEKFILPPPEVEPLEQATQEDGDYFNQDKIDGQDNYGGDDSKDADLFDILPPEQIRELVNKITTQKLSEIKAEYKKKLKEKESAVLQKLSRANIK